MLEGDGDNHWRDFRAQLAFELIKGWFSLPPDEFHEHGKPSEAFSTEVRNRTWQAAFIAATLCNTLMTIEDRETELYEQSQAKQPEWVDEVLSEDK